MEQKLSTQQLIGNLIKVGHKSLDLYIPDGLTVVGQNPDLFGHLIAWNQLNGEIRDSKIAFPIVALRGEPGDKGVYHENAIAHLLLLDPRNLVRAAYFHRQINGVRPGGGRLLKEGIPQYLRAREESDSWWDRTTLQHRRPMKTLYALYHIKPSSRAQSILFDRQYPANSVFAAIRQLKNMAPVEAAGTILNYRIPFIIAIGALGGVKKNTDVILSLIEAMSATEVVTNSKMLLKLGVMENPVLKSAYEKGISKAQKDQKTPSLKAGRASSFVGDQKIKAKLEKLQEAKIDDMKGIEGDWLILGDKSGSMRQSIEKAKEVAAFLARTIRGKVYLVFFDTRPVLYDVSGKSLEEIKTLTSGIRAGGYTSIGCGIQLMLEKRILINGIIIVSDGGENESPRFNAEYTKYEAKFMISPNIYLLHVPGEFDALSGTMRDLPYEKLEVEEVDYYGLPNLVKLLRSSRYTLIDEIMQSRLLTINEALKGKGVN